jgi:POT family proton-dependent oligopeptide transporter
MTAVGNFVAGKIGEATGGESGEMTQGHTLSIYWYIGLITIGIGVVVLALSPIVKRWMHLDTLRDEDTTAQDLRPEEGLRPKDAMA